jgi:regulatory protein YycI of two-component signal transduction system YycFG
MKFKILTLFSLLLLVSSCKINKTVNHDRVGKWVYKDTVNGVLYKSKGRYKKSIEIKTWRYYENRKLVKTEKYSNGICHIKTFDHKGRITSTGQSMMVEEQDGTHWYIIGEWTFFDEKGKIIGIRKYDKGVMISEEEIKPNPLK